MQTLLQVLRAIEAIAKAQPAIRTVVPNDVLRLNAMPAAEYGVFAWVQGEHREDLDAGILTVVLSLIYIDRLTADHRNELEVQSVGIDVLGNILRTAQEAGIYVATTVRYDTFNQRFLDDCAGVFCQAELEVPLDWICQDYIDETI